MNVVVGWGFWLISLAFSLVHGIWYADIFFEHPAGASKKPRAWKLHQFWLNFAGSLAGWIALWFLLGSIESCFQHYCAPDFGWSHVGLFFLAFLGITGYVPLTMVGLATSVQHLANVVAKWFSEKLGA